MIEACGVTGVRGIAFEVEKKPKTDGEDEVTQTALVRFAPLPLPWRLSEEELAEPVLSEQALAVAAAAAKTEAERKTVAAAEEEKKKAAEEAAAEQQEADTKPTDQDAAVAAAAPAAGDSEAAAAAAAEDDCKPQHDAGKPKVTVTPPKRMLDDGRRDGDAAKMSRFLAAHLADCRIELGGRSLVVDAPPMPVTLFVGNMTADHDDERLRAEMEEFGAIERCFVMRNGEGVSKGYGFVEFSLPASATAAKDAIEKKFQAEFNAWQSKKISISKLKAELKAQQAAAYAAMQQPSAAMSATEVGGEAAAAAAPASAGPEAAAETVGEGEGGAAASQQPSEKKQSEGDDDAVVKIVRAEAMLVRTVASMFSKSLYISNLPQQVSVREGRGSLLVPKISLTPSLLLPPRCPHCSILRLP